MIRKLFQACAVAGFALAAVNISVAFAADFPDKPIRLIVPFPPGGAADPVARLLGTGLAAKLGQPVVIDNRTGATGSIGAQAVAKANPDGYTLLFHTNGFVTNAATQQNPGYDLLKDFAPITRVASAPYLIEVTPSLPVNSIADLVRYAQANPGKLNYGSSGPGSNNHLFIELFRRTVKIDLVHVPFRGGAQQIPAVVAGDIQLVFDTIPGSGAVVKSGKLRAIAQTGPRRNAAFPDLPTVRESGVPFEAGYWMGVFAPANTPPAVLEKLNNAIRQVVAEPDTQQRLRDMGLEVSVDSPAEFSATVQKELSSWTTLVKQMGKLE